MYVNLYNISETCGREDGKTAKFGSEDLYKQTVALLDKGAFLSEREEHGNGPCVRDGLDSPTKRSQVQKQTAHMLLLPVGIQTIPV